MIVSFQNSKQKLNLCIFEIPAENSVILGNSCGNSWDGGFPGIPEWACKVIPLQQCLKVSSGGVT